MTRRGRTCQVWIVMLVVLLITGCGEIMQESPVQGNLMPDPDAPVSNVPGQGGSSGDGIGSGVTGRVIDAAGNPVVGAVVVPQSQDSPPHPIPELAVMTNEDGLYRWSLPPGRYTFTVHHDDYAPTTSTSVTVAPRQPASLDIQVQKR